MTMAAWIAKLDDFLKLSDREILSHAGKISHDQARGKAESQYAAYQLQQTALPQTVDEQFDQSLEELKRIEKQKPDEPDTDAVD
ncbi:MAG: hypothetical protein ACI9HK_005957 [Pirellulaceae bacterium]|jgi:hypothetical protein